MSSNGFGQPGNGHTSVDSSTGIAINFSSNNPFRNRAASPSSFDNAARGSISPFDDPPPARPVSRNPFIDQAPPPIRSPGAMSTNSEPKSLSAEDIFDSLTLDEPKRGDAKPKPSIPEQQRRPSDGPPRPRRRENGPPPSGNSGGHRPSRSQEESLKAQRPQGAGPSASRPGPSRSPQRRMQRRPRRNSESSVVDFSTMPITEEEMKMIEEKRRERERERQKREPRDTGKEPGKSRDRREGERSRSGKEESSRDGKSRGRHGRSGRRLDLIDQLDATSLYGSGFHHDGPFDALNPHRNRHASRRAPMHAFPKDSLNNSIGGSGPLNANPDHAMFLGRGNEEAFTDYARGGRTRNGVDPPTNAKGEAIFDPVSRGYWVHGDQSVGLGTSTFLEGTPAARAAIARRQEEQQAQNLEGGLQRKKSLAQRIRHINKGQRDFNSAGRLTSPDAAYNSPSPDAAVASAPGNSSEANPFFTEFNKGEENISVRHRDGAMSPNSPPAEVRRGSGSALERRATTDATASKEDAPAKPSGILGRMKSMKGPRKPRAPEARQAESSKPSNAGTAI